MAIRIELPTAIENKLRAELGDLDLAGREAMLVELYRQGRISHGELASGLDISRYQADELLKRHNVTEDLITSAELETQLNGLRKLQGP